MKKFRVGHRVILVNIENYFMGGEYSTSYSNTVGNVGVVSRIIGPNHFVVDWDNGSCNDYHAKNLSPILLEENV
ncbi:hypothetical protein [Salinivibrio phage CW02]|uniref:DUF4314 domain-containing protein n=1 Tax=Salinivibrio phage CW02 TaxID=1161935 RepID=H9D1D7_9CAUD|nr:hypothetical protein F490_gp58 [Salinivibrio phage CW02]AFE86179.1 hypothetical protein [Salinivibrio phage CW02]